MPSGMGAVPDLSSIMNTRIHRTHSRQAFTLLEMLLVVAVIVSLLGVASPAIQGAMSASRLKDSADLVYNRIFEAQQLAITLGTETELRIYQAPDLVDSSPVPSLRKVQVFVLRSEPDGSDATDTTPTFTPSSGSEALHPSIVVSSQPTYNSLLKLGYKSDSRRDTTGSYVAFRFHPDGSTNLPPSQCWFLTLIERQVEDSKVKPKNFITIQVDSATGTLRRFQPGA